MTNYRGFMKTKVKVLQDVNQSEITEGDIGYIDGYVRAADDRPYAAVVIPAKKIIDWCPLYTLEIITDENVDGSDC